MIQTTILSIIVVTVFSFCFYYNIEAKENYEPQIIYLDELPNLGFSDLIVDKNYNIYLFVYYYYYKDILISMIINFTNDGKLINENLFSYFILNSSNFEGRGHYSFYDKFEEFESFSDESEYYGYYNNQLNLKKSIDKDSKGHFYILQNNFRNYTNWPINEYIFEFSNNETLGNYLNKYSNNGTLIFTFYGFCERYIPSPSEGCEDRDGTGKLELGDGQFYKPTKIRVDNYDQFYVLDEGNARIQKFSSDGTFISKIRAFCYDRFENISSNNCIDPINTTPSRPGPLENSNGTFIIPRDLFISKNNDVYIIDNNIMLKYTEDLKFIKSWNFTKFFDMGDYNSLSHFYPDVFFANNEFVKTLIAVDNEENIYIYKGKAQFPTLNDKIVKFDANGNYIFSINRDKNTIYHFHSISTMDIDSQNNLYLIDDLNSMILKYNKNGKLVQVIRETLNKTSLSPVPAEKYNSNNHRFALNLNSFANEVQHDYEDYVGDEKYIQPRDSFQIVAIDIDQKTNELYMYDKDLNVQVFDEEGNFSRSWNASESR